MVPGGAVGGQGLNKDGGEAAGSPAGAPEVTEAQILAGVGVVAGVVERQQRQERKKEGEKMRRME